jgi:hypothetical protein
MISTLGHRVPRRRQCGALPVLAPFGRNRYKPLFFGANIGRPRSTLIEEVRFAEDSPLEETDSNPRSPRKAQQFRRGPFAPVNGCENSRPLLMKWLHGDAPLGTKALRWRIWLASFYDDLIPDLAESWEASRREAELIGGKYLAFQKEVITSASGISARIHPPDRSAVAWENRARLRGGARNRLRRLT